MINHIPVMLDEVIENLNIIKDGIYIDCTFGCGGHSMGILKKLGKNGKLISIDKDIESKTFSNKITDNRFIFINDNFSNINKYLLNFNLVGKINGILLDLGLSRNQISDSTRGFSFLNNGPLDMRMNKTKGLKAYDFINNESEQVIYNVLKKFGEDKNSKKIARNIIINRNKKKILKTFDLKKIILNSSNNIKSLARCFQAIRIYINNEIKELNCILNLVPNILCFNGILSIITFHSIEDKIVKNFFKISNEEHIFLNKIPITNIEYINIKNKLIKMIEINKIKPSLNEIKNNNSSRSAILRVFKKINKF
ncbi:16S rRNA (cytosine(1402)-N(4))-methyltransferase RsmH [endosymbiont of Pachyrhynchus infernalis]|uniref:16S rRNA (cytosine(1402)-N(4))-methyltransferase RsmH n=1 Tax=endosymbiont of Pachyrhynchus infernalis TaxID=1971488 RepID=UPI000DC6E12A|nr:16S rRNA (cytosine(1402)-N(4))-methyltransferase RsmH [endosymbiont of Pachyrhynchus infernalis]BBA84761.1 ribosomal RNA small subunit methyltransferase H [endosymbiont of Pachyrhynchus infernalis]